MRGSPWEVAGAEWGEVMVMVGPEVTLTPQAHSRLWAGKPLKETVTAMTGELAGLVMCLLLEHKDQVSPGPQ